MTTIRSLQLAVGILTLGVGVAMILGRNVIVARHSARMPNPHPAMLWIVLGGLLALVGVTQLAAFAL